jgi:hypothetical protein
MHEVVQLQLNGALYVRQRLAVWIWRWYKARQRATKWQCVQLHAWE